MTNKEFSERLIARIEDHKKRICRLDGSPIDAGYALAHEHIIELISIEALLVEAETALRESKDNV